MSIEDPRLSSIDNTSAADDFDSAVEQHLGFASETGDGIEVAQAETPDAGRTDRLPAQTPIQTAAAAIPSEVAPNAENVVTLPAGIELDNLEFAVEGDNLVLVLADGTEIVVLGGAANIPTFVIGDVELPQVALFAALEGSNINVAAGPDGTFSAQGGPTASRTFNDDPIDAGPEDLALADLLGDTAFGDDLNGGSILGDDGEPTIPLEIALTESFIYDEAVIADGDTGNQIITGTLPFNPGPDFGTISRINFTGASNVDEEGLGAQVLAGFTSGGRAITVTSFPAPTDGADLDFLAIEGRDSEGNLVFTLTVTNRETGDFTFELVGKLEHPDAGADGAQDDLDDLLRLGFTYTVTDLDGDSVTGSFNIDVMDDAPTFGEADAGAVDEDYLYNGNLNDEDQGDGEGDFDDLPPREEMVRVLEVPVPNSGTFTSGSLGINWGADNGNAGGNAGLTGEADDRGVAFTEATLADLAGKGLTSDGVALEYALSPDGTTIVAYKPYEGDGGSDKRLFIGEDGPVKEQPGDWPEFYGEPVFIVSVSDIAAKGTYEFRLVGNIDHPDTTTEDDLAIEFIFTAQDSDGDTASSSFTVTVNDDSPILVDYPKTVTLTVDEDDIDTSTSLGTAPNDDNVQDGSYTGAPGVNTGGPANATSSYGSLQNLVRAGADENVSFSLISTDAARTYLEGLGLKSNGLPLGFDIDASGKITGFVNSQAPGQAVPGQEYNQGPDRLVFEFEVKADGTFKFSLSDQLDHPAGNGENTLTIDFGSVLQANDGDGDSVSLKDLVKVNVTDDVPVIATGAKPISVTVDEDDIDTATSKGTEPNDKDVKDGSFTGTPGVDNGGPANATSTGNLSSLVKVGADENVTFSLISTDAARTYLEGLGLKSNGLPLGFDIDASGKITGFVNSQAPGQAVPGQEYDRDADRLVFEFELKADGTFTFSLSDQLDHPAGNGQNTLTIDFGSVLQANDNDGDSVGLTGLVKVNVTDDVPVIATGAKPISVTVDEDDIDTVTSKGTAPNDKDVEDGSFTGTPGVDNGGPANATSTGNLSSLVKVGADENVSFSLINQTEMRGYLEGLKLTSNGSPIGYDLRTDGTIFAFVNAPGGQIPGQTYDSGDRLVFEFKLNSDGTFKFSLSDQLDHPAGNGQNTLTIDFGSVLQATDNDGDSVKLTNLVKVNVTDDVPVIAPNAAPITIKVDEDDIDTSTSLGTSPNDGNVPDGSYTGTPATNTAGPANATSTGNLSTLVNVGADENVSFSLISTTAMRTYLEGLNLKSNGALIGYDLRTDGTIIAFVNAPGGQIPGQTYDSGDRLVFEFKLNSDGTFKFSLSDQLDHTSGDGKSLTIDFGSVLQANDKDGDSVKLTNLVKVEVTDDVPELVVGAKISRAVDEDDILNSQSTGTSPADGQGDGSWTGGPGQNGQGGAFIDGSLASVVKGGADDTVKFSFIDEAALRQSLTLLNMSSKGEPLSFDLQGNVLYGFANVGAPGVSYDPNLGDRPVFKLTLNENGTYTFELLDQLDHDAGAGQNTGLLGSNADAIDFGSVIKVTDYDGDSVVLKGAFSVTITDDVPVLSGKSEDRLVDEDDIKTSQSTGTSPADGQEDGSWTGGPGQNGNGGAFIDGSLAGLVKGGADDTVKFSFIDENAARAALEKLGLRSEGAELSYDIRDGVLYAFDNAGPQQGDSYDSQNGDRLVFKLTLGENGSYTFELVDQLDHDLAKGQNTDLQDDFWYKDVEAIDFGSIIKATDNDGDSVSLGGAFSITIKDDVPVLSGAKEDRIIDEDDIATIGNTMPGESLGTSPNDGNADDSYTQSPSNNQPGPAYISGSLANLVKGGADDPINFAFISEAAIRSMLSALELSSKGALLSYDLKSDGTLYAFDNAGPYTGDTYDTGSDRLVFSLKLNGDGSYEFRLFDQLDHDRPGDDLGDPNEIADENYDLQDGSSKSDVTAINFGKLITATDYDGDSISLDGAFSIKVRDDIPEAVARNTDATLVVDETSGQQNDDVAGPLTLFNGVANKGTDPTMSAQFAQQTGFVASEIEGGADDDVKIDWALKLNGADGLASGLMTTDGRSIMLFLEGDVIVGRYDSPTDNNSAVNASDPAAFALHLSDNGTLSMVQYVSIKHDDPADHDETNDAADGNLSTALQTLAGKINAVLTVTDFDGDKAVSEIAVGDRIQFEDDGPVASGAAVSKTADEDDLYNAQSQGTSPDGDSELALLGLGFAATVRGSVGAVVAFGADGAAAGGGFLLAANAAATMTTLGLESKGGELSYQVFGNSILAYVNGGNSATFDSIFDRPVFSLELDPQTGNFVYRQYDQLDHVAGNAESTALQGASGPLAGIDFGAIIDAKDGDGDVVNLTGKLTVNVVDDIPEVAIWTDHTVTIDETDYKQNDDTTSQSIAAQFAGVTNVGSDTDMLQSPIFAKDDVVDTAYVTGTDENVTKSLTLQIDNAASGVQTTSGQDIVLFLEGGLVVGRVGGAQGPAAFAITIDSDGDVSVAQYMSLKHPNTGNADEGIDLSGKISAVFSVKDFDGDIVTKSVSIGNKIVFEDDGPSLVSAPTTGLSLNEDDLVLGNDEVAPKEALSATGNLDISLGADGGSVALSAEDATWDANDATLTADDGSWMITLNADGSYKFDLLDNTLAHGFADNGQNTFSVDVTYTATDGDQDVLSGSFKIEIVDDVPVATGEEKTVREADPASGGNLVLAFDVSGSMSDRVAGPGSDSRLQVAKDAAINLINATNAGLVLIVTFAGSASASQWMTKEDALDFIQNDIPNPNGSTDYDDVIDAIRDVTPPSAPTSVYFFSDGDVGGNDDLNYQERQEWEQYLDQNGMKSYAVGVGSDISVQDEDLKDVAWPGEPIVITSPTDPILLATVVAPVPTSASGNVLENDSFGADGGRIQSITVGGVTFTWDGAETITKSGSETGTISGFNLTVASPLGGSFTFDFKTGAWTYAAPAQLVINSSETFNYVLVDGDGDTTSASLTINLEAVNDAPVNTVPSSLTAAEDTELAITGLSVGDVDANGGDLTVKLEVEDGKLTLANSNGLTVSGNNSDTVTLTGSVSAINAALAGLKYKGDLNFNGADQLKITTTDNGNTGIGGAKTDTDTVAITVTPVNDAPVLSPETREIEFTENGSGRYLFSNVNVSDVDNPSNFNGGTIEISLGNTAVAGDQIFSDGWSRVSGGNVQILTYGGWTTIGTLVSGGLGDTSIKINLTSGATEGRVEYFLETIAYKSTSENPTDADRTVTVTFSDGGNSGAGGSLSDTSTITVKVNPVNDDPVFNGGSERSFYVDENTTAVGSVTSTDVDGGTSTYAILSSYGTDYNKFDIDPATGAITFKSAPDFENATDIGGSNYNNTYEIDVSVSDGKGGSDVQRIKVTVNDVNEAPVLTPVDGTRSYTEQNAPVSLMPTGAVSDPDSPWNFEGGSLQISLGETARPGDQLVIIANLGVTLSGTSVRIGGESIGTVTGLGTATMSITFDDDASDSRVETLLKAIGFQNLSDDPSNAARTATVIFNDGGNDGSGGALSDTSMIMINVTPVNDAPVVANAIADQSIQEEGTVNFTVPANAFTDVDSAPLSYTATLGNGNALPSWLTFNAATKTFSGTAPLDYNGAIDVKVTASDGSLSVSDTFKLTVTPVNDAPVVANAIADQSIQEEGTVNFTVPANAFTDVDSAPLSYTATLGNGTALPSWLTFNAATKTFSGTAPLDYNGAIDVKVTASDGSLSVSDTFKLTVTPVNDAPVVANAIADQSIQEEGTVNFTVPANAFTDVDSAPLSYTATLGNGTALPSWLTFNAATKTFSGTAPLDYNGAIDVKVTASDGSLSVSDTFKLTVTPVNDAPVMQNAAPTLTSIDENAVTNAGHLVSSILGNSVGDVDAGAVEGVAITGTANGNGTWQFSTDGTTWVNFGTYSQSNALLLAADDKVRFVPNGENGTTATFNYVAWDQTSGAAGNTVNVTTRGGSTAFSLEDNTATITVTEVLDTKIKNLSFSESESLDRSGEWRQFELRVPGETTGNVVLTVRADGDYSINDWSENISVQIWSKSQNAFVSLGTYYATSSNYTGYSDSNDVSWKVDLSLTASQLNDAISGGQVRIRLYNSAYVDYELGGNDYYGVTLRANFVVAASDPIILDLDKNGFALSSIDNGVTFDINADGKGDQIAWTSDDGILAYDVDGNGLIDNGSEIFTPDFNGERFASGVAALASLDSNGDGKIDANDDAFSKLQVWVDADNDGVSDDGELSSLSDNGVASIALTTDQTGGEEDGQTIFAEGEFTFADGSTGNFVEVGFETIFGSDDGLTVIGTDGDDILHGGMGQVVMTGGAGADTFVFDETALSDLDVADVITDFNSDEGDVLDVTALLDSLLGEQATAETAASHLRSTVEDGNTTVSVQTGVDTWKDVVVLNNHDTAVKVLFDDKHSVTVTHD